MNTQTIVHKPSSRCASKCVKSKWLAMRWVILQSKKHLVWPPSARSKWQDPATEKGCNRCEQNKKHVSCSQIKCSCLSWKYNCLKNSKGKPARERQGLVNACGFMQKDLTVHTNCPKAATCANFCWCTKEPCFAGNCETRNANEVQRQLQNRLQHSLSCEPNSGHPQSSQQNLRFSTTRIQSAKQTDCSSFKGTDAVAKQSEGTTPAVYGGRVCGL